MADRARGGAVAAHLTVRPGETRRQRGVPAAADAAASALRRLVLRRYMARSARSSTLAGVSSGSSMVLPAEAPTASTASPWGAVMRLIAASSDRALVCASVSSRFHKQHDELVAAQPRHQVGGAHLAGQHHGDRLEHRVAGGVAMTVVDRLEPVEIDVDQDRAGLVALHIGERALQLALEAAAIDQVGERIDLGARLQGRHAAAGGRELELEPIDLLGEPHRHRTPPRRRARLDLGVRTLALAPDARKPGAT